MYRIPTTALLLVLLPAVAQARQGHAAKEFGEVTQAKIEKLFRQSCANCHTNPDTEFTTDRAWLGQVFDTA